MMTMPDRPLDLNTLADILREEGWDVFVAEDVIARREGPGGVWNVYADRAGRVRLEVTREAGMPQGRRITVAGREYRVLREVNEVINVLTTLGGENDLPEVLRTFEDIVYRKLWEEPES